MMGSSPAIGTKNNWQEPESFDDVVGRQIHVGKKVRIVSNAKLAGALSEHLRAPSYHRRNPLSIVKMVRFSL